VNFRRRFLLTGARGAFGSALKLHLEREGASVATARFGDDWTYDDYGFFNPSRLQDIDVLVLSHGAKTLHAMDANCASFVAIIERYLQARKSATRPAEIWGLGSEIEFHPTWGIAELADYRDSKRAYARYAAHLYRDPGITYRHIVPSAFTSRMGPGLISADTAARMALFLLRRNWKYVPVTYSGFAYLNYFRFRNLGRRPK